MIATIATIIIINYLILIGSLYYGFGKVEDFKLQDLKPKTKFSIVVPFRNEEDNLPKLLQSIFNLNYPKHFFEVILVNDDSEDDSIASIEKALERSGRNDIGNITIIDNKRVSNSPKKDAIAAAVSVSKYDWIVTTDADCELTTYWLDAYDEFIQTNHPNCVVAPVTYNDNSSFFKRFQALDILSLQGATIGGFGIKIPFLCNGANFAYNKEVFKSINGFDGNTNIASGDDIFLLEKFKKLDAKNVKYLKSQQAIVTTAPVSSFKELVQQRLRWASKTSHNPNRFSKVLGLVVVMANLICVALIPLVAFNLITAKTAMALVVIKFGIDFLLLFKTVRFFKQESLLFSYIFSSVLYPFFSVYIVVLSLFKSYHWKNRTFRK